MTESTDGDFAVDDIEALDVSGSSDGFGPTALGVHLSDGETTDYFLSAPDGERFVAKSDQLKFETDAAFAMVRTDGEGIESVRIEGGSRLMIVRRGPSLKIDASESVTAGRIVAVDYDGPSLLVDTTLPEGDYLHDRYGTVETAEYSRNSQYEIDTVERTEGGSRVHLTDTDMTLSRGIVGAIDGNVLVSPADFPFTWTRHYYVDGEDGNEYFDGRLTVLNEDNGARTTVTDSNGGRRLTVEDTNGFEEGDTFAVIDVKEGDEFRVPLSVEIRRTDDGEYAVDAPDDVRYEI